MSEPYFPALLCAAKRTIQRTYPGAWLLTRGGDNITLARNEHADAMEVPLSAIPALIADLQELAAADAPMVTIRFVR